MCLVEAGLTRRSASFSASWTFKTQGQNVRGGKDPKVSSGVYRVHGVAPTGTDVECVSAIPPQPWPHFPGTKVKSTTLRGLTGSNHRHLCRPGKSLGPLQWMALLVGDTHTLSYSLITVSFKPALKSPYWTGGSGCYLDGYTSPSDPGILVFFVVDICLDIT